MKYDWKKEREKYQPWKREDAPEQEKNTPPPAVPEAAPAANKQGGKWGFVIVLIAVAAFGYYLYSNRSVAEKTPIPQQPAATPSAPAAECRHSDMESRLKHGIDLHQAEKYREAYASHLVPAAKAGYGIAVFLYALYGFDGTGGAPVNVAESLKLMHLLAEKEFHPAEYLLAVLYASGKFVEKDSNRAREFLKRAAAHGNEAAKKALEEINRGNRAKFQTDLRYEPGASALQLRIPELILDINRKSVLP